METKIITKEIKFLVINGKEYSFDGSLDLEGCTGLTSLPDNLIEWQDKEP